MIRIPNREKFRMWDNAHARCCRAENLNVRQELLLITTNSRLKILIRSDDLWNLVADVDSRFLTEVFLKDWGPLKRKLRFVLA
jgi:hypothetical protein